LKYKEEGESEQALYSQITEGYAKAIGRIKDELGYDLSNMEVKFNRLPVRSPVTTFSMSVIDPEGEMHRFDEEADYQCGEWTPDGKGIKNLDTVDPDKLADKIYTALSQDRELLRLKDVSKME